MKKASSDAGFFMGGGEEENRTPDLVIANDALSQLSYPPPMVEILDRTNGPFAWRQQNLSA